VSTRTRRGAAASRIRADVRLVTGEGFTRRFQNWAEVANWLTSPAYVKGSDAITTVRLIHTAAQRDTPQAGDGQPAGETS
jgi:hypothetical protein